MIKKESEVNEINVPLSQEELSNNNINISIHNNADMESKKEESNIVEYVNIQNNEEKLEESNQKDTKDICMMEIEENIKEEKKEKNEDNTC